MREKIHGRKYCTGLKDVCWRTVDCKVQTVRRTNKVYGTMFHTHGYTVVMLHTYTMFTGKDSQYDWCRFVTLRHTRWRKVAGSIPDEVKDLILPAAQWPWG